MEKYGEIIEYLEGYTKGNWLFTKFKLILYKVKVHQMFKDSPACMELDENMKRSEPPREDAGLEELNIRKSSLYSI